MSRRYYVKNEIVPFEEDGSHEFKGHRSIHVEDLPPWTMSVGSNNDRPTRRAVSRVLNAFINTGKGGTVYLGVLDNGEVKGIQLTEHQKDHVKGSIQDLLMSRYKPPVKSHRYRVKFVPVVRNKEEGEQRISSEQVVIDSALILKEHIFRSSNFCWCDKDSVMQCNSGVLPPFYIIEIRIKPWDPDDPLNAGDGYGSLVNVHPIHEDEEGQSYFRQQASLIQYTVTELARMTRHEVQSLCEQKIDHLQREIVNLQRQKEQKVDCR